METKDIEAKDIEAKEDERVRDQHGGRINQRQEQSVAGSKTTRTLVSERLQAWQQGKQNAEQVWLWAHGLQTAVASGDGSYEDELVRDVIDILAALPQDLVVLEDAEVMLYGLANPPEEADLAQNLLWNHMDSVDTEGRRVQLAEDPFYGEFCGPIF